jgi:Poly(3-hydroxybutyrate) depolymerase
MLSFHGLGSSAEGQGILSGFTKLAEEKKFIVVFPESTTIASPADGVRDPGWEKQWNAGYPNNQSAAGIDDLKYVDSLLNYVETTYRIDAQRIYVSGVSNGAMFAQRVALTFPQKIAAAGCVVGTLPASLAQMSLSSSRAVPIILFLSDADPVVPYGGTPGVFLSATDTLAFWIAQDGAANNAELSRIPPRAADDPTRVRCEKHLNGRNGAEVQLYTIEGGGHAWPGGMQYAPIETVGRASQQVDATRIIWDFVARYSLP